MKKRGLFLTSINVLPMYSDNTPINRKCIVFKNKIKTIILVQPDIVLPKNHCHKTYIIEKKVPSEHIIAR